ncbi:hypothetical protein [Thiolinea disciformis]|uniref:hypothetical protein n=1 Tax=Thiolinea disciformis TaxID=125614 RepID=UPI00036B2628|nr:hypothetical protein [Thiolinea disciformis]
MTLPQRENYAYHPRYCEENIWWLCQQPDLIHSDVLVIAATEAECFPILCQREANAPDEPLLWDYHVVLLWHASHQAYILDFDTTLPFCTPLERYFEQSFLAEELLYPEYVPLFRVIKAKDYARDLKSDRRHMKTKKGWLAPPPPWPVISESESNLNQLTTMLDQGYGKVLNATALLKTYNHA